MPKASPFLASSNSGEFSPRMDARVDFDKYISAISRGLNLICLPQGGLSLRPGTRFISDIGNHSGALFPFSPITTRSYMLHMQSGLLEIYRNQGRLIAPLITAQVTNGNFTSDISGWTSLSTGSASISWDNTLGAGTLLLNGSRDGYAWAQTLVTVTESTATHIFRFFLSGNYGSKATVMVGTTTGQDNLFSATGMGMGWHTVGVVPGPNNLYFQVRNEQDDDVRIHSVSLLSNEGIILFTPYISEIEIQEIRTAQTADVLYLFHDNHPIWKLERRGDTSWSLVKVFIEDGPWLRVNPETDLQATQLVKNSRFDGGMGSDWAAPTGGTGYVKYDAVSRVVQFAFLSPPGAGSAGITQLVTTNAPGQPHVIHFQVWGDANIVLDIGTSVGVADLHHQGYFAGWFSVEFTPPGSTVWLHFYSEVSQPEITNGIVAAFMYTTNARLLRPSPPDVNGFISVTALGDFTPFTASDVGRLLRFEYPGAEPGWCVIVQFLDPQTVLARPYRIIPRNVALETWRFGAWSDTTGWPHLGVFYQQRLMAARTASQPQSIWGSQTADFENFRPDSWVSAASAVEDNDGLNFTIAADRVTPIMWMAGSRRLVAGTGSGQWLIVSSQNKAVITPSDFNADPQTSIAALDIAPVQIDNVVLFAQRAKRSIFDLGYASEVDSFRAADVTILSDHITRGNVAQLVYQAEPFSNVWVRLETGTLAVLTYKRGQNVVGWTPIEISGQLETPGETFPFAVVQWLAVIPGDIARDQQVYSSLNRDELWMIVSRTINGVRKNYIEVMEGFFDGPNKAVYLDRSEWKDAMRAAQVDAFYLDSGLTYQGPPISAVLGLFHLEGQTVAIYADGSSRPPQQVVNSRVFINPPASVIHVGLPYPWVYRTLKLPYGSPTGAGVGQSKTVSGLVFVLRDSGSLQYAIDLTGEGESEAQLDWFDVPHRRPDDPMGQAVPLFTGEVEHTPAGGYATDPRVLMRGLVDGAPFTLLGIVPKISEHEL